MESNPNQDDYVYPFSNAQNESIFSQVRHTHP